MKRIAIACSLLLVAGSVANAATIWTGLAGDHKWSTNGNWDTGVAPVNTTDEARINTADYVNVDCDVTVGMLRMCYAATTDVATLNCTAAAGFTGHTLKVTKDTGELISCGYLGAATINQDTGTVIVHRTDANPIGELRITRTQGNPQSYYNLSGGTLKADIVRGGFTANNPGFVDTGGLIHVLNIYRIGTYDGTVFTWSQGASTLAPGSSVGNTDIGQSGYEEKWTTAAGSHVEIEMSALGTFDTVRTSGNADTTHGTLDVVALGSYVPNVNDTFDVIKATLKTGKSGTGTFDSITDNLAGYFSAAWVDTDADAKNDTLRLTYLPEPATLMLLLMGGSAVLMRRRRA